MRLLKCARGLWRLSRNLVCAVPLGRRLLFPSESLARRFGRSDAEYAWRVFLHHYELLTAAGFSGARSVLEVGPGQNLGTALLWWTHLRSTAGTDVQVVCWDVFRNADVGPGYWSNLAGALLDSEHGAEFLGKHPLTRVQLERLGTSVSEPRVEYRVASAAVDESKVTRVGAPFDFVYSHAALEHVWKIEDLWTSLASLTAEGGWHSHRIDLADHGRRHTNPVEMLEWSPASYWLTMRFIPGAINRWRAGDHLSAIERRGLKILVSKQTRIDKLPVPRHRLARRFRDMEVDELRTTAIDLVARREPVARTGSDQREK